MVDTLAFALVCASLLATVTPDEGCSNACDLAVPIAEVAIERDRKEVFETAVLPMAPTPDTLEGRPAAIGVRKLAEAARREDGLEGLLLPPRPVPTPPTKELVVALTPFAV